MSWFASSRFASFQRAALRIQECLGRQSGRQVAFECPHNDIIETALCLDRSKTGLPVQLRWHSDIEDTGDGLLRRYPKTCTGLKVVLDRRLEFPLQAGG